MLGAVGARALADLGQVVGQLSGLPGEALRDALLDAYPALARRYGAAAASAAIQFYRELREPSGVPGAYEPMMPEAQARAVLESDARWAMGAQFRDGADRERLARDLSGSLTRRVYQGADDALTTNARRDPAHPRWAIVPHAGACAWCVMIGSRGFVYKSRKTALAQRHRNCRCTPVVDFDRSNPHLDGYDPERLGELHARGEGMPAELHSAGDPAADYFGRAEDDDPKRLGEIKAYLSDEGVTLRGGRRGQGIGYNVADKGGGNARLHYEEGMSISAWEHELDHYRYDKELGFPGIAFYLSHQEIWDSMEERAYGIEIDIAVKRGQNELEEKLRANLREDARRRHGQR